VSIENAERFLRRLEGDAALQEKVRTAGPSGFEAVTAQAGASCTAYELACAVVRGLNGAGSRNR
jgi:hypothetical protein